MSGKPPASDIPSEKSLEQPNPKLARAGITTIHDKETLRECVGYENANHRRGVDRDPFARRAEELQEEEGEHKRW